MLKVNYKKIITNVPAIILAAFIVIDIITFFMLKKQNVFPFIDVNGHIRKNAYTEEYYKNCTVEVQGKTYVCDEMGDIEESKVPNDNKK